MGKRDEKISYLKKEQAADLAHFYRLHSKPQTGRPSDPLRDTLIYKVVAMARKRKRPKHPGLKPVPLSWDKAYVVAQESLRKYYDIHLSIGAIRAACVKGKKIAELGDRILERSGKLVGLEYASQKPAKKS